jgi:pimeloyl-ACP methyl ester carboxylesterase
MSIDLSYERRGTGEPLVLLHGLGHHRRGWEPVLDALAAEHDVIAIDLPGFGRSPVPTDGMPTSMPELVDLLAGWMTEQGLQRPHLAGCTVGGTIALELAAVGHAASATVFSPAGFWHGHEVRRIMTKVNVLRAATFLPAPLLRVALKPEPTRGLALGMLVHKPERLSAERAWADILALRNGSGFRAVARIGRDYQCHASPTVPVTIGWGESDRILPLHMADLARERIPQAEYVTLPGCGHMPMSDDPALITSVILDTIASATSPAA